jgi:glycosyltransferase involved in cell wall biosynthesis
MTATRDRATVSVVIPCFNQARYLRSAIESALGQHLRPLECIVVDDGSTDETAALAESLGVIVLMQANRGVSEARNAGLAAARGDLVVFLDADDELLPDALAHGAAALTAADGLAAVVGRCQGMDAQGRPLRTGQHAIDPSNLYGEWLSRNFVWTPGAAMFRRAALLRIGGFPAGRGPAADYAVYLRLARTNEIASHAREVVRYRQHDASMSRDPALMLRQTLRVLREEQRAAPRALRPAFARGRETWRMWYGQQILDRLRADCKAGRFGRAQALASVTLMQHCPRFVAAEIIRKARNMTSRNAVTVTRRPAVGETRDRERVR